MFFKKISIFIPLISLFGCINQNSKRIVVVYYKNNPPFYISDVLSMVEVESQNKKYKNQYVFKASESNYDIDFTYSNDSKYKRSVLPNYDYLFDFVNQNNKDNGEYSFLFSTYGTSYNPKYIDASSLITFDSIKSIGDIEVYMNYVDVLPYLINDKVLDESYFYVDNNVFKSSITDDQYQLLSLINDYFVNYISIKYAPEYASLDNNDILIASTMTFSSTKRDSQDEICFTLNPSLYINDLHINPKIPIGGYYHYYVMEDSKLSDSNIQEIYELFISEQIQNKLIESNNYSLFPVNKNVYHDEKHQNVLKDFINLSSDNIVDYSHSDIIANYNKWVFTSTFIKAIYLVKEDKDFTFKDYVDYLLNELNNGNVSVRDYAAFIKKTLNN